jgi:hypothetical protein
MRLVRNSMKNLFVGIIAVLAVTWVIGVVQETSMTPEQKQAAEVARQQEQEKREAQSEQQEAAAKAEEEKRQAEELAALIHRRAGIRWRM